uniref:CAP domain-containing protein (inferred by orthology to a human protein) n=1 Tax=Strongyloides venezuelensis TaxID=75913 RepID=A0A0K0FXA7_STRVS
MIYLSVIFLLLTLLGLLGFSYGQRISYSWSTKNGVTVYNYNGKEYPSFEAVQEAIKKEFPNVIFQSPTSRSSTNNGLGNITPIRSSNSRLRGKITNGGYGKSNGGFDITPYKGNNTFSNKIFDEVWDNYNYDTDSRYGFTDMKKRFLTESNRYRRAHNVHDLIEDSGLATKAQIYAEYLARINKLIHDPKNTEEKTGENLAFGSPWISHLAVKNWYDEISQYDFKKPEFSFKTGHFTQLVWRDSKRAGFGVAVSADGRRVFVVCKYTPPGNYAGEFKENVLQR